MLAALNRPAEFEVHFKGAIKNGCSIEEIKEQEETSSETEEQ